MIVSWLNGYRLCHEVIFIELAYTLHYTILYIIRGLCEVMIRLAIRAVDQLLPQLNQPLALRHGASIEIFVLGHVIIVTKINNFPVTCTHARVCAPRTCMRMCSSAHTRALHVMQLTACLLPSPK